jgi:hypothetical protein
MPQQSQTIALPGRKRNTTNGYELQSDPLPRMIAQSILSVKLAGADLVG